MNLKTKRIQLKRSRTERKDDRWWLKGYLYRLSIFAERNNMPLLFGKFEPNSKWELRQANDINEELLQQGWKIMTPDEKYQ